MAHDVFISHSYEDRNIADAVCATLEQSCVRCWVAPRDLLAGMEYAESITDAIYSCRLFILVLSRSANESHQVCREVERAVSRGLQILPFRIENVRPSRALDYLVSSRQCLDALTSPLEGHLRELTRVVKSILPSEKQ
jgi:hypothetical protein